MCVWVWCLQDQVDNGIPLSVCLKQLGRWLSSLSEKFAIVYNCTSADKGQHPCTFTTWSGNMKLLQLFWLISLISAGKLDVLKIILTLGSLLWSCPQPHIAFALGFEIIMCNIKIQTFAHKACHVLWMLLLWKT